MTKQSIGTLDLQALVRAATLAPSSHNTQPWLFGLKGDIIELHADRTRALPVNDPDDRELTISCGCALFNLRVAAAAAGYSVSVDSLPDPADPDLLARLRFKRVTKAPQIASLHPALAARRTYRQRFAARPVEPKAVDAMTEAASAEGGTLSALVSNEQRTEIARAVAEADALLWASPSWRRELAAWMHPRRSGDGITLPGLAVPIAQMVVRSFDMGHGVAAKDSELADESPLLVLLTTQGDMPADWLAAGQALQRLLLVAVLQGLQASYLSQPLEVAALRQKLTRLAKQSGHAQALLRLGTPRSDIPATPRRPLADVLITDA